MNQQTKNLNFLIIGAQKSGTTTLYQLLREHPDVFMPAQKEIGFFANPRDDKFSKGIDWYLSEYFSPAISHEIIGEASPQYMCCRYAAGRIAQLTSDIKLIAVLRNPIDRAYSGYKMEERASGEQRKFEEVLDFLFANGLNTQIEPNEYLMRNDVIRPGLYGTILNEYLTHFKRSQIHICFMEDMERYPKAVIHEIYKFLGVDDSFIPPSLNKKLHQGGKVKYKSIAQLHNVIRHTKPYIPAFIMKRLTGVGYWLQQWNVTSKLDNLNNQATRERLRDFYKKDIDMLEKAFSIQVPWQEFSPKNQK